MRIHEPAPAPDLQRRAPVTVASVPAGHVYVRHLSPVSGVGPVRLPDPVPPGIEATGVEAAGARWWPPVMLDPGWAAEADFDVFHVHFGFDATSPAELEELVATLRRRRKPLVVTVHDLRNPHHLDRSVHDAHLDVLVGAADAVLTLTPGAADEVALRWGRSATVVPHPHVVDLATMETLGRTPVRAPEQFTVGVHLKSLRPSMAPMQVVPALMDAVAELPDARLQVNIHRDVMRGDNAEHDAVARMLLAGEAEGQLDLDVHDFLPDADLWRLLSSLDASVLPYRFGTHSGWLEACRDLGTTVIAPTCGHYLDQGPVLPYTLSEETFVPDDLRAAVHRAHDERPAWGATVQGRLAQRAEVARMHEELYRELVA